MDFGLPNGGIISSIGGPPNEFDFRWDAINGALNVAVSGVHFGPDNIFTPGIGYEGTFLILSALIYQEQISDQQSLAL